MLMAAGVEPPTQVWAHGFLTGRRREDVEDEPHRDPPVRADRPVRRGLLPLLLHARDAVRRGRQLLAGSRWSTATTRTSRTGSGTSPSRVLAMLGSYFDGRRADSGARGSASDLPAVIADAARRYDEHMLAVQLQPALVAVWDIVGAREPVPGREGAVEAREGRRQRGRSSRRRPLRRRRDPPDPRGADPADHARGRRSACGSSWGIAEPLGEQRVPGRDRVGTARSGHPHDQGREPLSTRRGPSSDARRGFPPRLHSEVRLVRTVFHVKLPGSTRYGDPCKLAARERPEP